MSGICYVFSSLNLISLLRCLLINKVCILPEHFASLFHILFFSRCSSMDQLLSVTVCCSGTTRPTSCSRQGLYLPVIHFLVVSPQVWVSSRSTNSNNLHSSNSQQLEDSSSPPRSWSTSRTARCFSSMGRVLSSARILLWSAAAGSSPWSCWCSSWWGTEGEMVVAW